MAHKRMFSKDITSSDAFREMPTSSQALYFHLGMEADDDGFLDNYKGLMRAVNATDDDLRILITKRFLILFPSKVVVVKHWLINNTVRKDRYSETKHLEEKRALIVKENGSYTEHSDGLPNGNQMATQYRIEEDSIVGANAQEKIYEEEDQPKRTPKYPSKNVVSGYFPFQDKSWLTNKTELESMELLYLRGEDSVKSILKFVAQHSSDPYFPKITKPSDLERKWRDIQAYADRNGL